MIHYAVLPPEINSAQMYAGAGSGPILTAATAWDGLAAELRTAAASFGSLTSGLVGGVWQGPASVAMAGTAVPYVGWLSAVAGLAEEAGAQARAAAGAFEAALTATVHPAVVAANRDELVLLAATNLLGQNATAIAATEAEYEQMWAADVAAMVGYHAGASAMATQLTPWQQVPQNLASQLASAYADSGLPRVSVNLGSGNAGSFNVGFQNTGYWNLGLANTGYGNIGLLNTGNDNIGIGNTGNGNFGFALGTGNIGALIVGNQQVGLGSPTDTALILGGTGFDPLPPHGYMQAVEGLYITPSNAGYDAEFLVTPEKLYPLTGLTSLAFDTSVAEGTADLNAQIMALTAAGHHAVVFGYSQSATIASLEMRYLEGLSADQRPAADELSFVLIGNPDRPDGGFLERFDGAFFRPWDFTFFGATPVNAYPTTDIAIQYDGAADFPQYPLDIFADANAVAGFLFLHPLYPNLTPAELATGVAEPVSAADHDTTYILIPSPNLPMLDPLRVIPFMGNPLADLIQPDLKVLVDLGYDRTADQDVPTTWGLFPNVSPGTVVAELQQGAGQGVDNALRDLGLPPV